MSMWATIQSTSTIPRAVRCVTPNTAMRTVEATRRSGASGLGLTLADSETSTGGHCSSEFTEDVRRYISGVDELSQ